MKVLDVVKIRGNIMQEQCRRSLYKFAKMAWPVVEPAKAYVDNWHIEAICQHLQAVTEKKIDRLIINMPPGHMKSILTCVIWPAWEWLDHPGERSLYGSYDEKLAFRDADKSRDLMNSDWYQITFEPKWHIRKNQDSKSLFVNTFNGMRYSFGMGKPKTGWRGSKVVLDDPLSADARYNKSIKQDCEEKFTKVLSTRVNQSENDRGAFVVVMQRLSDDDLSGFLEKQGCYTVLKLPAEYQKATSTVTALGWSDPRTEDGELLFPRLYNKEKLEVIRNTELGPIEFESQYNQNPAPDEGSRFRVSDVRYWDWHNSSSIRLMKPDGAYRTFRVSTTNVIGFMDVAVTEKTQSDYTVIALVAFSMGDIIVLDLIRNRFTEPENIRECLSLYKSKLFNICNIAGFVVESNGVGKPLIQHLLEAGVPTVAHHAERDLIARTTSLAIRISQGKIYIPSNCNWSAEFLRELARYPAGHDDQVSAMALCSEYAHMNAMDIMDAKPVPTEEKTVESFLSKPKMDQSTRPEWYGPKSSTNQQRGGLPNFNHIKTPRKSLGIQYFPSSRNVFDRPIH